MSELKKLLIKEIDTFANRTFQDYFIVLFGSFSINKQNADSDFDIICFAKTFTEKQLIDFKLFFLDLCKKNNVSTKTQIPYERSIIISYDDLNKAIKGSGFIKSENTLIIPERVHSVEFYTSDMMRFRFAFNAISTLNELISGSKERYIHFKNIALEHLIGYIFILNNLKAFSVDELVEATIFDCNSKRSEGMFLGYKNSLEMRNYLQNVYYVKLTDLLNKNFVDCNLSLFLPSTQWIKEIFNGQ